LDDHRWSIAAARFASCVSATETGARNVTPQGEPGARRYGQWAGMPRGVSENTFHCVEEIQPRDSYLFSQCSRKRGHGQCAEYCKQHAKLYPTQKDPK
jgi:hypothetical protein